MLTNSELGTTRSIRLSVSTDAVQLDGDLVIPHAALGLVLFAHGSGSSRLSPRNVAVARLLQRGGFATLLLDLLSAEEERVDAVTAQWRFDIPLLSRRLIAATDWALADPALAPLPIGYFGASTGAAAALIAAANRPHEVHAVVSRGGRPDLAGAELARVQAPTLLIVGGADSAVIDLNREAMRHLQGTARLALVPGATHLFEEAGALEQVATLARRWFETYLVTVPGERAWAMEPW